MIATLAEATSVSSGNWYDCINGGGEFFSHFVFTLLASVVLSSKWRDYLIEPRKDDMEEFRQEVKEEIEKVRLCGRMDPQLKADTENKFESCRDEVKKLRLQLRTSTSGITKWCKGLCWLSLVVTVVLIATGWDKLIGFLCVLGLLPIPICRRLIDRKYEKMQDRAERLKESFESVRDVCQNQYNRKLENADNKFRSFSSARLGNVRRGSL